MKNVDWYGGITCLDMLGVYIISISMLGRLLIFTKCIFLIRCNWYIKLTSIVSLAIPFLRKRVRVTVSKFFFLCIITILVLPEIILISRHLLILISVWLNIMSWFVTAETIAKNKQIILILKIYSSQISDFHLSLKLNILQETIWLK